MVEEIADATGSAKAAILAEIFDATLPSFVNTLAALKIAKEQPREAQRLVQNFAAQSVMELQQQQLELDAKITASEKKRRRRRGSGTP
jgi:outer membrane PBP1 activator LpoA protein